MNGTQTGQKKPPGKIILIAALCWLLIAAAVVSVGVIAGLSGKREASAAEAFRDKLESAFRQSLLAGKNLSGFSPQGGRAVSFDLDGNRFSDRLVPAGRVAGSIGEIDEIGFVITYERGPDEDRDPGFSYRDAEHRSFDVVYATMLVSVLETVGFTTIGELRLVSGTVHRTDDDPDEAYDRLSSFDLGEIEAIISGHLESRR